MAQQTTTETTTAITELIATNRGGAFASEVSDELRQCIAAAAETGKKAELTLKVTITPSGASKSGSRRMEVQLTSAPKLPKVEPPTELLFVDGADNLSRRDPNQPTLPGIRRDNTEE